MKVLPPWMIKEGMNLTKEQRGEVKQESNMEGTSAAAGSSDDKKSIETEDVKNIKVKLIAFCMVPNLFLPFLLFCPFLSCLNSSMLFNDALMPHLFFLSYFWQDEYVKAYYEALFKRQREQEEAAKSLQETSTTDGVDNTSTERHVGMKSKREEEDEGEDIEWEEAPPAGKFYSVRILQSLFKDVENGGAGD